MSNARAKNQTKSFLRRRFAEAGIRPVTHRGQNFLIDMNLQRLLVDSAKLDRRDVVLEVGTGTGALTALMAERAGAVVTVEVDHTMHQLASEELYELENVTMLCQDALKNKNKFAPEVIDAIKEQLEKLPNGRFKLLSNLPFSIATPVLSNLLLTEIVPTRMVGTIQKELADRIVAVPNTKDYKALSIWMQSQCQTQIVRIMPPSVFWPEPNVMSAIVRIDVDESLRAKIPHLRFFHQFVRAIFLHRRKFMRSVVLSAFKKRLTKGQLDAIMADFGMRPDCRAEQLDVETILAFCEAIRAVVGDELIL